MAGTASPATGARGAGARSPPARAGGLWAALAVIATYLVCGAAIRLVGRAFGLS